MSNFNVPHIIGTRLFVDHQYWPTISREAYIARLMALGQTEDQAKRSIDRSNPAAVTLEQLLMIAWGVREWKVDALSFNYVGLGQNQVPGAAFWTLDADAPEFSMKMKRRKNPPDIMDPFRDVTDERDILGPSSDAPFGGSPELWRTLRNVGVTGTADPGAITATSDATPPYIFAGGAVGGDLLESYVIYDPDIDMFYPLISVGGLFSVLKDDGIGGTNGVEARFYVLPVTPTAPPDPPPVGGIAGDVQQGTLTVSGVGADIVIPLGMFGGTAGSHPTVGIPDGGSGSVDVTMSVVSWWPCKNGLGQSVYDETSGAQINDPFA